MSPFPFLFNYLKTHKRNAVVIKCVSFFSKTSVQNIYHAHKYSASYACDACENAYRSSYKMSVWCQHNKVKLTNISFHGKNVQRCSSYAQTDQ